MYYKASIRFLQPRHLHVVSENCRFRAERQTATRRKQCFISPEYPAVLAWSWLRHLAIDIADRTMADAFPLALNAEFFQQLLEFRHIELLLGSVNPDASQPQRMRGQHHIAHDQAAVIDAAALS